MRMRRGKEVCFCSFTKEVKGKQKKIEIKEKKRKKVNLGIKVGNIVTWGPRSVRFF